MVVFEEAQDSPDRIIFNYAPRHRILFLVLIVVGCTAVALLTCMSSQGSGGLVIIGLLAFLLGRPLMMLLNQLRSQSLELDMAGSVLTHKVAGGLHKPKEVRFSDIRAFVVAGETFEPTECQQSGPSTCRYVVIAMKDDSLIELPSGDATHCRSLATRLGELTGVAVSSVEIGERLAGDSSSILDKLDGAEDFVPPAAGPSGVPPTHRAASELSLPVVSPRRVRCNSCGRVGDPFRDEFCRGCGEDLPLPAGPTLS